MSFCPACQSEYPDDWKRCPKDEAALLASQFVGKYKVESLIGVGGMGAVYKAFNPDTKSVVALKLMHRSASAQDDARKRFEREAASIAALKTRHVVTIYDFGREKDGTLYLVMEFLKGHTLRHEIGIGGGAMESERVNAIMSGALRGLASAHRAGITHRDLKPDNIFIADTDDGEVSKILDFGIARANREEGALTQSGALMGTPAYMPPEQVAGERDQIGPWTDVYAMGVILYEMLSGAVPFSADSVTEILRRVLAREFEALAKLRPDLPKAIHGLVEKALANAPKDRFQNADEMRQAWDVAYRILDPSAPVPTPSARMPTQPSAKLPVALADTQLPTPSIAGKAPRTLTPGPVVIEDSGKSGGKGLWIALGAALVAGGGLLIALPYLRHHEKKPPVVAPAAAIDAGLAAAAKPDAALLATTTPDAGAAAVADHPTPDDMVKLEGGSFQMGIDLPDQPDADPLHPATVAPFWLDKTELTYAGYARARAAVPALPPPPTLDKHPAPDLPVRYLSWNDASAVCAALGKRLPSESEWEWAATHEKLDPAGASLMHTGVKGPTAVATHKGDCTSTGVCDLLGNLMEFTGDHWRAKGQESPDPTLKAVRGASYSVAAKPANLRFLATPHFRVAWKLDTPDPEIGFRCAKDAR